MDFNIIGDNDEFVYIENCKEIILSDLNSALDLMATVQYEKSCNKIAINKENICEDFFDLKNGIAGEILQKFVNYNVSLAIIGDFSNIKSKALNDFIYECNTGSNILFLESIEEVRKKWISLH